MRRLELGAIKDCYIAAKPGAKCATLSQQIESGKIDITGYAIIGLLIGTNDIDNVVYSEFGPVGYKVNCKNHHAPAKPVSMNDVLQNFVRLLQVVGAANPNAVLVVLALIPRLGDWDWSYPFTLQFNDFIQKLCCQGKMGNNRLIFAPTYKFFLSQGAPVVSYYAWDGIHLSQEGLKRVRQCAQQALADGNIKCKGHWKRKPQGRGQAPEAKRRRLMQGNNVVFQVATRIDAQGHA